MNTLIKPERADAVMKRVIADLFQRASRHDERESVVRARNKAMREINLILDMDIKPIPAKEQKV